MKIGDMIYGSFPGVDTYLERVGLRRYCVRIRDNKTDEVLRKVQLLDYGKRDALRRVEQLAREVIAQRTAA